MLITQNGCSFIFTLMITWGSNNYFVKSSLLLVWLLSEFGINVQKQYNFTIFSNKNEKVEILEIWLILIITSLHLLYVWSEFGINVQKQYNFTIFTLMIYQWGSDNRSVTHFASIVGLMLLIVGLMIWLLGFALNFGNYGFPVGTVGYRWVLVGTSGHQWILEGTGGCWLSLSITLLQT